MVHGSTATESHRKKLPPRWRTKDERQDSNDSFWFRPVRWDPRMSRNFHEKRCSLHELVQVVCDYGSVPVDDDDNRRSNTPRRRRTHFFNQGMSSHNLWSETNDKRSLSHVFTHPRNCCRCCCRCSSLPPCFGTAPRIILKKSRMVGL